jgi:outer membrane lipoprotein SlyB
MMAAVLIAGCAGGEPPGASMRSATGTVLAVSERANLRGRTLDEDRAGALVGGLAGTVVGSLLGAGSGRAAAAGLGFVSGLFLGALAENALERRVVTESRIRLDDGEEITLIARGEAPAAPGARVRITARRDGSVSVVPLGPEAGGDAAPGRPGPRNEKGPPRGRPFP